MLTDRDRLGLRGGVKRVTTFAVRDGSVDVREFDQSGRLLRIGDRTPGEAECAEARRSVEVAGDGSQTESIGLSGASAWAPESLHGIAFGTYGARTVDTTIDNSGRPVQSVFLDDDDQEVSVIRYRCDQNGRVVEAAQFGGAALPNDPRIRAAAERAEPGNLEVLLAHFGPGREQFKVRFEYDEHGYVTTVELYHAASMLRRTTNTHNELGDIVLTTTSNDRAETRFEYDYDDRGNWTRRVMHRGSDSEESMRTIEYFSAGA
jgi:hypothetical protein